MGIRSLPTTTDTARWLASFSNASEFSNQSGSVTGYSPCFPQPALIKILGRRVYIYKSFGETRPLSPQASLLLQNYEIFLSRQNFCHDKYLSLQTKFCVCCDKHTFVATSTCLSRQSTSFVAKKVCLSRQNFCFDNTCSSRQKSYLWQLPPTIPAPFLGSSVLASTSCNFDHHQ